MQRAQRFSRRPDAVGADPARSASAARSRRGRGCRRWSVSLVDAETGGDLIVVDDRPGRRQLQPYIPIPGIPELLVHPAAVQPRLLAEDGCWRGDELAPAVAASPWRRRVPGLPAGDIARDPATLRRDRRSRLARGAARCPERRRSIRAPPPPAREATDHPDAASKHDPLPRWPRRGSSSLATPEVGTRKNLKIEPVGIALGDFGCGGRRAAVQQQDLDADAASAAIDSSAAAIHCSPHQPAITTESQGRPQRCCSPAHETPLIGMPRLMDRVPAPCGWAPPSETPRGPADGRRAPQHPAGHRGRIGCWRCS